LYDLPAQKISLTFFQPVAHGFDVPTAATSFAGSVLVLLAVSEFISVGDNDVSQRWWGMQAPVRLLFFFALTAWSYMVPSTGGLKAAQGLGNNVVFTWSFLELGLWFWIYNGLMSEKQQRALWAAQEHNAKIEKEAVD